MAIADGSAMEMLLAGGKSGVDVGLAIIPGVLAICMMVMMLTNGASDTGAAANWLFKLVT